MKITKARSAELVALLLLCASSLAFAFVEPSFDVDERSPDPMITTLPCEVDYIDNDGNGSSDTKTVNYRIWP